ncbi:MAG: citryl-CoA lyase [Tetrasphaera sp.]
MTDKSAQEIVDEAHAWWTTEIIDIHPGKIAMRGYPIEQLIGTVTFPEMIWLMLKGELLAPGRSRLLEAALVAAVDHGPHAPSISISRMSVTCGLPVNGAMASAINVLDDVHGGAGQQCMTMLYEIAEELASPGEAGQISDAEIAAATATVTTRWRERGTKYFPGFGHRFHPLDPRAPRLLALVDEAAAAGAVDGRFARIGRAVEAEISAGRSRIIPMNIDAATAVIYCELGLEPELGRGVFILSRSVGILSHAWEQKQQGGRIKGPMPKSIDYTYAGPARRDVPARPDRSLEPAAGR